MMALRFLSTVSSILLGLTLLSFCSHRAGAVNYTTEDLDFDFSVPFTELPKDVEKAEKD